MESDSEEIAVAVNVSSYDGPLPYNYEPPRRERGQAEVRGRVNGQRREIELWCEENRWRIGQVSWPLAVVCDWLRRTGRGSPVHLTLSLMVGECPLDSLRPACEQHAGD
ncbi:unnamed protein product [Boreogadus saida]